MTAFPRPPDHQSHRLADQARVHVLAEQDLVLRTAKAYFDVLIAQESVSLADAQAEAVSVQLAQAQKMYEIGLSTVTDRDDAQARYDAIQAAGIAARNNLDKAAAFRRLTGLSTQRLVPVAPKAIERAAEIGSLETVLARARQESPPVRAQQLGVEMARLEIEKHRLESSPLVSLTASVGPQFDHGGIASSGGRDRTLNASIGLVLFGTTLYRGRPGVPVSPSIDTQEQEQVSTLEAVQRDAEQLAQQHFLELSSGVARVQALEQARMSAETAVASSKLGREVGVRTVLEVLTVEQAYFQTLYNLVAARYGVLFSRINWQRFLVNSRNRGSRKSMVGWSPAWLKSRSPDGVASKRVQ